MQNAKINKAVDQITKETKICLLKLIANDYGIQYEELYNKYISIAKNNEYVEMFEFLYEKKVYLVDNDDNIYSYNIKNPKFLGKRLADGTIEFRNLKT